MGGCLHRHQLIRITIITQSRTEETPRLPATIACTDRTWQLYYICTNLLTEFELFQVLPTSLWTRVITTTPCTHPSMLQRFSVTNRLLKSTQVVLPNSVLQLTPLISACPNLKLFLVSRGLLQTQFVLNSECPLPATNNFYSASVPLPLCNCTLGWCATCCLLYFVCLQVHALYTLSCDSYNKYRNTHYWKIEKTTWYF